MKIWQVDFKSGDIRHFEHYPSIADIANSLKGFSWSPDDYTEEDLWEMIEEIGPCEWH